MSVRSNTRTAMAAAPPPAAYRDVCVGELLTRLAEDYPDREALIFPNLGSRYTFRQLDGLARQMAKGLLRLGISRGDRVALWAPNIPEWVIVYFAATKIGAVLITVNTKLRGPEIAYLLRQSEACALITVSGHLDVDYVRTLREIIPPLQNAAGEELSAPGFPHLRHLIYIGKDAPGGMISSEALQARGSAIADDELEARARLVGLDDVILLQYTSGTTGFPKGVMLSSRNIVNNAFWLGERLGLASHDKLCLPISLFHCFGCIMGVLGAYTHAAAVVPLERFNPLRALEYIERERCSVLYSVPTMFIAMLEHLENRRFDLTSLRTGIMAGSPVPESVMRRVIEKMHLGELTISYGLTEASPGITITRRDDSISRRTQTVGLPLPEVEVKIVDPTTGQPCPTGQSGELCCRGYNVMKGYYNDPEATAKTIDGEGWLHTGDLGVIDGEGYVKITGRIKDLIIRGGENIAPIEIEDLLRRHPKVADAYVFGVPDEKYGEDLAAAIRLKKGEQATASEIRSFCQERIARFKVPRYLSFVEDFPLTASGKVQRFKLREMHADQRHVDDAAGEPAWAGGHVL